MKETAGLEPLPEDLRALLEAERRGEEPPAGAPDRVLLRLGATVGLPAPFGQAPAPPPRAGGAGALGRTASLGGVARLARAAAIFVAGAASGAGGYRALEHVRRPAAPVAPLSAHPERPAPPSPVVGPPVVAPPAPSAPAAARPRRPAAAPAAVAPRPEPGHDSLAAERSLLEIARAALVRGQAEGALAALARHEAAFPRGELTEEREGLFVQALVAARRYDEARARAADFNRRYPRSLFAPVVAQALGSIP